MVCYDVIIAKNHFSILIIKRTKTMKKQTLDQKLIHLGIFNPNEWLAKKYKSGMSGNELSEMLWEKYDISVSARHLTNKIKKLTPIRKTSEHKKLAIRRGRMVYFKKPESEKYKRIGMSYKRRLEALESSNFRCSLCGRSVSDGAHLEIHHKNSNSNELDNLQVLCFECHRGIHSK